MTDKAKSNWKNLVVLISFIIAMGSLFVSFVREADLNFDNQKQKNDVIDLLDDKHPISASKVTTFENHVNDKNYHMTFEEKKDVIIIKQNQIHIIDNQVKLGQDMAEIKQLIKNNR